MIAVVLACVALLGLGFVVFWIEPLAVLGVLEPLTPNCTYQVRIKQPLVALSFDDGPHPTFTPQVLDILERYDAKATFFLIGERALNHPEVVFQIKAAGHELGNHYFTNGSTLLHSDANFVSNLEKTEKALRITAGPKLFRPPGGLAWPRQPRLARTRGYQCVLGCAYPHDPMHPPVCYLRWLIEKNLRPGTIVILHDGISDPTKSIQVLPQILAAGREKGLRFVSIGTLMEQQTNKQMRGSQPPSSS
jgi:peptidoglycan/xylan/chitin deacetylase (PgdA/CDA1 family)